LRILAEDEREDIRQQFDELGYWSFTPVEAGVPLEERGGPAPKLEVEGKVTFEAGSLSREEAILNGTLEVPQDITGIKKLEGEKRLLDDTSA
jgi:hypothetical protein